MRVKRGAQGVMGRVVGNEQTLQTPIAPRFTRIQPIFSLKLPTD